MDHKTDIYADGIGEITLSGGMVRMDLVTLVGSQKDEDDKPRLESRNRVIMPPDGFLRSFTAMEDLVKKLIEAGLIKKRDEDGAITATAAAPADAPKSPNF